MHVDDNKVPLVWRFVHVLERSHGACVMKHDRITLDGKYSWVRLIERMGHPPPFGWVCSVSSLHQARRDHRYFATFSTVIYG